VTRLTDDEIKKLKECAILDLEDAASERSKAFFRGILRIVKTIEDLQQENMDLQRQIKQRDAMNANQADLIKQLRNDNINTEMNLSHITAEYEQLKAQVAVMREAIEKELANGYEQPYLIEAIYNDAGLDYHNPADVPHKLDMLEPESTWHNPADVETLMKVRSELLRAVPALKSASENLYRHVISGCKQALAAIDKALGVGE
jgi:Asp-tRNA(Asn)/Glu-tRNA(Gln) amidotransferase C subunit